MLGLDRFHICILGTIDHMMQGKWTNTYIWHHICRIYNSAHRTWESCLGSYKSPFDTICLSPWCWSSKAVRFWSNYWRKWWAAPPKCIPEEVKFIWQRNYTGVKHLYKNLKIIPPLIMLSHQCLLSKSKEINQKQHVCGSSTCILLNTVSFHQCWAIRKLEAASSSNKWYAPIFYCITTHIYTKWAYFHRLKMLKLPKINPFVQAF